MLMADTARQTQSGKAIGSTRFAAGCGAAFAVLLLVGFALQDTGASSPSVSTAEVVSSYSDADTELRKELGATVVGFAVFFLLVFLGSLRSTLRRAEGADHLLSSAAFAGGVVMVVFLGASAALETAVASAEGFYDSYRVDPSTVLAFSTLALWALGFAMVGAAVLIGGASLLAWKCWTPPQVARDRRPRRRSARLLRRVDRRARHTDRPRGRVAAGSERHSRSPGLLELRLRRRGT
jgi:hypothetical protein